MKRLPRLPSELTTPPGRFTNLDKVYWPDDGFTKSDLIAYYRMVAPVIVPHLRDRPVSLNRHPNGITGPSFFQKDFSDHPPPAWVKTVRLPSETRGTILFALCQDEPSLLYLANLGCIELNVWLSRVGSTEKPDFLIMDLDPQQAPFPQVVEAALTVRKLLDKACAACFVKTSGKTGLHIYVPVGAKYDYDQVRLFAQLLSNLAHQRMPTFTSVVRDPSRRRKLVYLDFLQNRRGQTMAGPYSVRPVPGALVSTPLEWKEVRKNLDPGRFTMRTVPRRIDKLGDLWRGMLAHSADLLACLRTLESLQTPRP